MDILTTAVRVVEIAVAIWIGLIIIGAALIIAVVCLSADADDALAAREADFDHLKDRPTDLDICWAIWPDAPTVPDTHAPTGEDSSS
jgi:hypothetical protein